MRQLKITSRITNRNSIALEKYFTELSKESTLTAEEELTLAKRIRQGDIAAYDKLIKANLRFVVSVAKQYEGYGMPLEDLISEGNIGLMKAAKRFDETRGYKFISYAVFWIRQTILKSLNEYSRIIRLPGNQHAQVQKVHAAFVKLEQQFGREPSIDEVGAELDLAPDEVNLTLMFSQRPVSTDRPVNEEDQFTLLDKLANENSELPEQGMMDESVLQDLYRCLDKLSEREAKIVQLHYGLDGQTPLFFSEIAEIMGLGKERVRQLNAQAISKLRSLQKRKKILSL